MPHVAIVVSGAYRTLPDCNASVSRHVIDANSGVHFHVYAHLTTEMAGAVAARDVWSSFPCVVSAALETNAAVSAAVRSDIGMGTEKLPRGRGTAQGKAMNIIKMFRGIAAAQRLLDTQQSHRSSASAPVVSGRLPPPAVQHGSRCGATGPPRAPRQGYDLVLRLRPDLCFCSPLDLKPLLERPGGVHHVWLPWWSAQVGWAFDQIAVGPPAAMTSYADAYETTVRRLVAAKTELYPEAVMWAHLASLGPHARLLRPLRGFRAGLARNQPRFHIVDPYSKLKQDMAVVQPSLSGSLPAWACSPSAQRDEQALTNRTSHAHVGSRGKRHGVNAELRRWRRVRTQL